MQAVFLVWLIAAPAGAAERPGWLRIPYAEAPALDPERLGAPPDAELRKRWAGEGHGYVELLSRLSIRVEASGHVESRAEMVRHFLTDAGIQEGGNLELYADESRDQLSIEAAYAVAAGGKTSRVDPATLQVVEDQQSDVFSDWQRVVVPFAGLSVGSNAVLVATRRFQTRDLPTAWSRAVFIGSEVPIAALEITIDREPGSRPLVWANDDPQLECKQEGVTRLRCRRVDIPAVQQDPDVVNYPDLVPHLLVGFDVGWDDLRRRVGQLVDSAAHPTPELKREVATITAGAESPKERFRRIHRFVSDEIRYVALSHGDWAFVPRDAGVTLQRRYGDCKDKVTLLVAMGKLAGLDVYPVLTSVGRYRVDRLLRPAIAYFDHMIACANLGDETPTCVDATVSNSGLELPVNLGGAIALELRRDAAAGPTTLPREDFGWDLEVARNVSLSCEGAVSERVERRFRGASGAALRSALLSGRSDARERWAGDEYREALGEPMPPNLAILLGNASNELAIRYTSDTGASFDPEQREWITVDPWLLYYARAIISHNRHHPYRMGGLRYRAEETFEPCDAGIVFHGPTLRFASKFGKLDRRYRKRDGKLLVSTTLELPAEEIRAAALPEFERFVENALGETSLWLTWNDQP
jgi:transglutaminase-like putative cysteine protease